jgi:hypothetical protein
MSGNFSLLRNSYNWIQNNIAGKCGSPADHRIAEIKSKRYELKQKKSMIKIEVNSEYV